MNTPSYTARHMARLVRKAIAHIAPKPPWDDEAVISATHDAFNDTFGYYPSECPEGDSDGAFKLVNEAAKLACQEPGPTHLSHVAVEFRKPDGSIVTDTTSYSIPGAWEAAQEDAHRYGWELVLFKIVWR